MSTCMCKGYSFTLKPSAGRGTSAVYEWSSLWCMHKLCSMVPNEWSSLSCMHSAYLKANITTVHSAVCNSQPALSHAVRLIGTGAYYSTFMVVIVNAFYMHLRVETMFCYVDPKFFNLLLLEKHVPLEEMKVHVSMAFPINCKYLDYTVSF